MQQVLIVDDSAEVRKLLLKTFESYSHKFKTLVAKNGKEAANIVAAQEIDLVVTDIQMPVMDGMELIEFLEANRPGIPVFIIAGTLTPEVDEKVSSSDHLKFFAKPLSPRKIAEKVFEELAKNAGGEMHGVSIPSFLQLMEMEKRTGTLMIRVGNKSGQLFLRKGVPVDAHTGDLKGETAACEMISWDKATIQIKGGSSSRKAIETPLMALIIEATRLKDERADSEKQEQSEETHLDSAVSGEDTGADEAVEQQKAQLPPGLIDLLVDADDVDEYRIFNEDDFVLNKSETVDSALKVVPSDYFRIADPLTNQLASGAMALFQIDTQEGGRYIFMKYKDIRLLLSARQGFQPKNFLKALEELSSDVQGA
jgi:CheY-like chemotaxis protein